MNDLRRHVQQVAGDEQVILLSVDEDNAVARCVAGRVDDSHARHDVVVAGLEVQRPQVLQCLHREAPRERGRPLLLEERPIVRVYVVPGIREPWRSVRPAHASRMVGMQMREHDVVDVVGHNAHRPELVIDPARHLVPRGTQMSDPGVDQDDAAGRAQEERVDVPRPAIGAVGREGPRVAPSFGIPIHIVSGNLLGEWQRGPSVAEGYDLERPQFERFVRHPRRVRGVPSEGIPPYTPAVSACPSCGTENILGAKFCSECGAGLAEAVPAREARKTVTVLFCDVTGSTELGERLDPESLRGAMERYFDRMQTVLETHGGTVEKFIGDAIMAVFGVPRIHEDDAVRAVRAAAEMREALADLNGDLDAELGITIVVRTGINTGEVVAGDRGGNQRLVTGDAVNTAARLEQAANPGEILIGERTFELARDAVEAEPVDPLALKGKAEAVGAYRLVSVRKGVAGHERRLDAPMIGREEQLRALLDAFEGVVADRACHLFTVLGPAGIGKSRLTREFRSLVDGRAALLSGRCLSYGEGITFWPITEMAIQAAGITDEAPPEQARAALRTALGDAPDSEAIAAQLADVLGIGGGGPVEASWAIRRFLEALSLERPVVAVLDDIHWAEPTLLDVIEHVADWSRDAPILLLCMARPELLEERPEWGGGKRNATSVHLEPLSEPEADALIESLLGHPALTPEIRQRIRAAAQGNPLFVEEMLHMLLDDGVLVLKEDEWVATVDLTEVQVPPAISVLLAARLDRLSPDERRVLEAASVVGEVFEPEAVRALVDRRVAERLPRSSGHC